MAEGDTEHENIHASFAKYRAMMKKLLPQETLDAMEAAVHNLRGVARNGASAATMDTPGQFVPENTVADGTGKKTTELA